MQASTQAQCANHAGTTAVNICDRCGTFICAVCSSQVGVQVYCTSCVAPLQSLPRAGRGARFAANLIDNFVVMGPAMIAFIIGIAVGAAGGSKKNEDLVVLLSMAALGLGVMVGIGVQIAMQVKFGQSVGKRLLKIKVVKLDGSPIELWRLILLRNVALHVAAQVCGLVGLIDAAMIFGDDQRCLHDLISESIVIDVSMEA
jgi:uncharacterized RDD family membrane protein YckC